MLSSAPARPRLATLAAVLVLGSALAACGSAADPAGGAPTAPTGGTAAGTRTVEHAMGATEVPLEARRIVTLTDQNALLPLLELGVRPVASAGVIGEDGTELFRRVEGYDTSDVAFVGDFIEPNLEAVAAQRPDLIVGYELTEQYEELSAIAPTVLVQIFDRPLTEALTDFAALVGEEDQAAERLADYEARVQALQAELALVRDELSVAVIGPGDPGQFGRGDDGQALGTVMADLDLLRPAPQQGEPDPEAAPTSIERIGTHDADVVLVLDFSGDGVADPGLATLLESPLTQNLAAARAGQLHVVDGSATVGAAWGKMDLFLDELERVLVEEGPDPGVVVEP